MCHLREQKPRRKIHHGKLCLQALPPPSREPPARATPQLQLVEEADEREAAMLDVEPEPAGLWQAPQRSESQVVSATNLWGESPEAAEQAWQNHHEDEVAQAAQDTVPSDSWLSDVQHPKRARKVSEAAKAADESLESSQLATLEDVQPKPSATAGSSEHLSEEFKIRHTTSTVRVPRAWDVPEGESFRDPPEARQVAATPLGAYAAVAVPPPPPSLQGFSQEAIWALREDGIFDLQSLQDVTTADMDRFLERHKGRFKLAEIRLLRAASAERVDNLTTSMCTVPKSLALVPLSTASSTPSHVGQPEGQQLCLQDDPRNGPRPPSYPPHLREIEVDKLFFTQKSIGGTFRCGRPLQELVQELCDGTVETTAEFLKLRVVEVEWEKGFHLWRSFHSNDNRRLWCLKEYKRRVGHEVFVNCRVLSDQQFRQAVTCMRHFDTENYGMSVVVRPAVVRPLHLLDRN